VTLTIGSLCSGYGGLDMAVASVLDAEVAWHADPDPGASAILAHHWPGAPNLGDISAVDWSQVEPVDILTAGFPCQDLSYAGRGAGIKEGTRSGLWYAVAAAVHALRPRLVVLENVRAITTRRPGLDVVLASLADLGFDAEWRCVRASDVGAPHERWRWFLLAWPADTAGEGRSGPRLRGRAAECRPSLAHTAGLRCEWSGRSRDGRPGPADHDLRATEAWGPYAPAVDRWAGRIGRPAPGPTDPDGRLNPVAVEWLMGLPAGHVTGVPGLTRTAQLHALGNGVVPAQAAAAIRLLLDRACLEVAS
jgi:DNA (cytosine-5)-methyltransferase 1